MSETQAKTHWGKKVILIGFLAALFLVSAAVEAPAEESCCPEGGEALSYSLVATPVRWDPAPWGAAKSVKVELIDSKTDAAATATFSAAPRQDDQPAQWAMTNAPDSLSGTMTLTVTAKNQLTYGYLVKANWFAQTAKGNLDETQWVFLVTAIKEKNIPFAVACTESKMGTMHVRLAGVRSGQKYAGVFSFRPPVEEIIGPVPQPPG